MNVTIPHYIGAAATIALFVVLGIYSGKKVKTADDEVREIFEQYQNLIGR